MFGNFFHKQAKASLYPSPAKDLEHEVQQIVDTQTCYFFPNLQQKYSSYDFPTKFVANAVQLIWQQCELLHTITQGNCCFSFVQHSGWMVESGRGFQRRRPQYILSCKIYYGHLITRVNNRKFIAAKIEKSD
jgi:hypothetical protein